MKYSIIIPIYNCMRYLESSVESVFNQKTDAQYEIILVDDGSTDGSSRLSDRLAVEHECVRVIHQANQGVSAARNAGIRAAKGEYLLFLDADDLWDENLLRHMELATKDCPDIVQFGFHIVSEDGHMEESFPYPVIDGETGREYLERILDQRITPVASSCTNAHRREFLVQNEIWFPEGITYGEDLRFRVQELREAQKICSVGEALYFYRRNSQSVTRNVSLKRTQDMLMAWAEFYHQFPKVFLADYYCMSLLGMADLNREEARSLLSVISQNVDILAAVRGIKPRIARVAFNVFGYYNGSKIIRFLLDAKNR